MIPGSLYFKQTECHMQEPAQQPHRADRSDPAATIRIDLFTETSEPIAINGSAVYRRDLEALSAEINAILPDPASFGSDDRALFDLALHLRQGDLGWLEYMSRQTPDVFQRHPAAEAIIEQRLGPIATLPKRLQELPDYDPRMLEGRAEFVQEVIDRLTQLNLNYAREQAPHLISSGGISIVRSILHYLRLGDLSAAIDIRANEDDKIRRRGALTTYINQIFGRGLRLQKAAKNRPAGD